MPWRGSHLSLSFLQGLRQKLLIASPHAEDGAKKKSNLSGLFKR